MFVFTSGITFLFLKQSVDRSPSLASWQRACVISAHVTCPSLPPRTGRERLRIAHEPREAARPPAPLSHAFYASVANGSGDEPLSLVGDRYAVIKDVSKIESFHFAKHMIVSYLLSRVIMNTARWFICWLFEAQLAHIDAMIIVCRLIIGMR
jgi:hypothetical protein